MTETPNRLETDWILAAFAERKQEAQSAYRRFVAAGKHRPSPWEALENQNFPGSDAFVDAMQRKIDGNQRLRETLAHNRGQWPGR